MYTYVHRDGRSFSRDQAERARWANRGDKLAVRNRVGRKAEGSEIWYYRTHTDLCTRTQFWFQVIWALCVVCIALKTALPLRLHCPEDSPQIPCWKTFVQDLVFWFWCVTWLRCLVTHTCRLTHICPSIHTLVSHMQHSWHSHALLLSCVNVCLLLSSLLGVCWFTVLVLFETRASKSRRCWPLVHALAALTCEPRLACTHPPPKPSAIYYAMERVFRHTRREERVFRHTRREERVSRHTRCSGHCPSYAMSLQHLICYVTATLDMLCHCNTWYAMSLSIISTLTYT